MPSEFTLSNRILIFLIFFIIQMSCHKDPCPETKKPMDPDPKPKASNCVRDDSLQLVKFRPVDRFGDTTNSSTVATLNYNTQYVGNIYYVFENDSIINITSNLYYNNNKDCITSYLFLPSLKLTKDTIKLNNSGASFAFLDCDVRVECYNLDTSKNNYFLFTSIDRENRFLTGEFFCQLKYYSFCGPNFSPEKLRFCDGKIRLKY